MFMCVLRFMYVTNNLAKALSLSVHLDHIVSSSVTDTTTALISPNLTSEIYDITITCTIHPDSTAGQCVVMVMADGRETRNGTYV